MLNAFDPVPNAMIPAETESLAEIAVITRLVITVQVLKSARNLIIFLCVQKKLLCPDKADHQIQGETQLNNTANYPPPPRQLQSPLIEKCPILFKNSRRSVEVNNASKNASKGSGPTVFGMDVV